MATCTPAPPVPSLLVTKPRTAAAVTVVPGMSADVDAADPADWDALGPAEEMLDEKPGPADPRCWLGEPVGELEVVPEHPASAAVTAMAPTMIAFLAMSSRLIPVSITTACGGRPGYDGSARAGQLCAVRFVRDRAR